MKTYIDSGNIHLRLGASYAEGVGGGGVVRRQPGVRDEHPRLQRRPLLRLPPRRILREKEATLVCSPIASSTLGSCKRGCPARPDPWPIKR
jgi:hypothetical protein